MRLILVGLQYDLCRLVPRPRPVFHHLQYLVIVTESWVGPRNEATIYGQDYQVYSITWFAGYPSGSTAGLRCNLVAEIYIRVCI